MKKIYSLLFIAISWMYNSQVLYDNDAVGDGTYSKYELDGRKWNKTDLTYYFENGTSDIINDNERSAVKSAFTVWSNATNLTFTEVFSANSADVVIKWATGNHGDGSANSFDGTNGVLAHAFYPPPNSGALAGDVHFDDDEMWTDQISSNGYQPIDLVTVAIHEIGHSLGLKHSQEPNAIMYAYYYGSNRQLQCDDLIAIDLLYPKPININGQHVLCNTTQQQTYTLSDIPCNQTPIWTYSSNLTKISETNNSITVIPNNGSTGSLFVKATFGTKEIIKNIWIGAPMYSITKTNDPSYYNESHFYLSNSNATPVGNEQGITQIKWTKLSASNVNVILHAYNDQYEGFASGPNGNWTMDLQAEVINSCGTSKQTITIGGIPCETYILAKTEANKDNYVVMRPPANPCLENKNNNFAKNPITILNKSTDNFQITVANSVGNIVISKIGNSFDMSNFPSGMYIVNITKDKKVIINQTLLKK